MKKFSIGDKIFNWEIVSNEKPLNSEITRPHYDIKCKCGKIITTRKSKLVNLENNGGSRVLQNSCKKCHQSEKNALKSELSKYGKIISYYKASAKTRKIDYNLTDEEAVSFFKLNCFYCDTPSYNKIKDVIEYTGLDRIDSNIGYVSENVQPCCKQCNIAKQSLSNIDFLNHIKRIYDFSISGSSTIAQASTFK